MLYVLTYCLRDRRI